MSRIPPQSLTSEFIRFGKNFPTVALTELVLEGADSPWALTLIVEAVA